MTPALATETIATNLGDLITAYYEEFLILYGDPDTWPHATPINRQIRAMLRLIRRIGHKILKCMDKHRSRKDHR